MPAPPPHRIDVLTLFPAILDGYLSQSILSRAIAGGLGRDQALGYPRLGRGETQAG